MEIQTSVIDEKVISPFINPLEFNDTHGPINYWPRIPFLYRPTFAEILEYSGKLVQGDVCIARAQGTRDAYSQYVSELAKVGRKPVDDIREDAAGAPYFLTKNKFPYELADAEHWLLFLMHPEATIDGAQEFLFQNCVEMGISLDQIFPYQNPHGLRSIPQLPHFQLIIRQ